ncbi:hypothetical protein BKK49_04160 [Rodentibacter rarus]|uniref:Major facilitator superfamily (MFS) profile domain-containing protein n=1 Tax=Rodentibacter rarus TaxID=1908260 RepID=A0A1V3IQ01_9PAST|nr:hypothetical protein [Rodentibacter rarus]OOF41914.1 hypothetical protein BKK49_04160 [Rodentibacter rarus]OOF43979.1 hypothetical protein BKK50_03505 [Rodentibacter rarus]
MKYSKNYTVLNISGGFLFGFDTAVISGTVESIRRSAFGFGLTSGELGFAVSVLILCETFYSRNG